MDLRDILARLFPSSEGGVDAGEGVRRFKRFAGGMLLLAAVVLLFSFLSLSSLIEFYTDYLWYESIGYESIIWHRGGARLLIFVGSLSLSFLILLANWGLAIRACRSDTEEGTPLPISIWHAAAVSALFSVVAALGCDSFWEAVLQFINGGRFGSVDPVFGLDIGFYVFELPFYKGAQNYVFSISLLSGIGCSIIYLLGRPRFARAHMTAIATVIMLSVAAELWLSRYDLLFSPTGIVYGMGYTDQYIKLPALTIMSFAALTASLLVIVNLWKQNIWKQSIAIVVVLAASGAAIYTFLPDVVQGYIVQPNEYEREREFLAHHIEMTRRAYSIDDVETVQIAPDREVTAEDMLAGRETAENIRLWDYGPLLRTYKQLQEIRTYYDFNDIDIDRYMINGRSRQVMLAVRELDLSQLQNRTWVNSHLEFTHGYGVVMNPVNEIEPGGLPVFFMKDLPPRSSVPIRVDRPEIYYGEKTDDYALVRTNVREFDYPTGDSNARSTYSGSGGVSIGSFMRRLLFAARFRDSEIIFTDALTSESRVLYNRNVREAIRHVAPFLILDADAYPVILDGRVVWLQDAYTWSASYPYSMPISHQAANIAGIPSFAGVNYIRNSVKVTVDAYDGKMDFYVTDDSDPVVKCWRGIFPRLFKDLSEAPAGLSDHFRYPEELFEVQCEIFRTYHMTDTNTFYNREDVWVTSTADGAMKLRPNYVNMSLTDGAKSEFSLITPFMPMGRNNLIGWMAARCDGDKYGELLAIQFPKQELVYGPPQVEALIDQNTMISSQLSLWSQHGSDVIRGDLLVIPLGRSLLYVEPLYLRAERGDMPELKRIILSTGGRLAWGETFEEAATALFGGKSSTAARPRTDTSPREPLRTQGSPREAARRAREHYEAAERAIRSGDWKRYGEEIAELGRALETLEASMTDQTDPISNMP